MSADFERDPTRKQTPPQKAAKPNFQQTEARDPFFSPE